MRDEEEMRLVVAAACKSCAAAACSDWHGVSKRFHPVFMSGGQSVHIPDTAHAAIITE